ncbi:response regulator [Salinarimonas soli]|uniref:Response regulator n=1 Tax=Salinarimonas soli TaxID=1638099 RepID=A0A5B2VED2_9HYPH|nr:response regulator [Salinarimonas soli]KAA2236527.1 response regulator [Salinarimonas soli]
MNRVLVIDDVAGVRRTIAAILRREGYEVIEARDGREGLDLARGQAPGIVITDLLMPQVDGIEVIEGLRRPGGARPKVLAISGGGSLVGAEEALGMAEGLADATLRKPFEAEELVGAVAALAGRP